MQTHQINLAKYNGQFEQMPTRKWSDAKELYENWKQLEPENSKDVSYSDYVEVTNLFNSLLVKYITEEGGWFKMPYGLGEVGVTKFMPRYYKPRFKKEGVELYQNPHSQGYVCKFSWKKDKVRMENVGLMRHVANTYMKQSMAKAIFDLNADNLYYTISREEELLTKTSIKKEAREKIKKTKEKRKSIDIINEVN